MSSTDPEQGPSPAELAERERTEKERKAQEDAEQSQLPYKWTQSIRDVDITIPVSGTLKGRDMDVVLTKSNIRVGVKGQPPIIEVPLLRPPILTPTLDKEKSLTDKPGPIPASHYNRRILLDPRNNPPSSRQRSLGASG